MNKQTNKEAQELPPPSHEKVLKTKYKKLKLEHLQQISFES